jgi:hypothetical protein
MRRRRSRRKRRRRRRRRRWRRRRKKKRLKQLTGPSASKNMETHNTQYAHHFPT